jgi:phosphoglycolate phosphatase
MHLLFDLDGTLTDPFDGITRSIVHALESLGRPCPERGSLGWCIGPPLRQSLARLLDTPDDELVEMALVKYRERFSTIGLLENKVYADIPRVLALLKDQGHTLFVATAKPRVFAQKIIDHFELRYYFNNVFGSELDGTLGEKSDLIAHIISSEALDNRTTVMIGDHSQDMMGAVANDIPAIGVLWGYGKEDELRQAGARSIVSEPGDLMAAISQAINPSIPVHRRATC